MCGSNLKKCYAGFSLCFHFPFLTHRHVGSDTATGQGALSRGWLSGPSGPSGPLSTFPTPGRSPPLPRQRRSVLPRCAPRRSPLARSPRRCALDAILARLGLMARPICPRMIERKFNPQQVESSRWRMRVSHSECVFLSVSRTQLRAQTLVRACTPYAPHTKALHNVNKQHQHRTQMAKTGPGWHQHLQQTRRAPKQLEKMRRHHQSWRHVLAPSPRKQQHPAASLSKARPLSHQHINQHPQQHARTSPAPAPETATPLAPSRQSRKPLSLLEVGAPKFSAIWRNTPKPPTACELGLLPSRRCSCVGVCLTGWLG